MSFLRLVFSILLLMWILVVLLVFIAYLTYRNKTVHDYRTGLIDQVDIAARVDVSRNRSWEWRYEEYRSITYNEMMLKFWKHVDSFYLDRSFLDPNCVRYGGEHGDEHNLQGGVDFG